MTEAEKDAFIVQLRGEVMCDFCKDIGMEEKAEEARDLSSRIADKEEVQPSQILQGSEQ